MSESRTNKAYTLIELQVGALVFFIIISLTAEILDRAIEKRLKIPPVSKRIYLMEQINDKILSENYADLPRLEGVDNPFGLDTEFSTHFSRYSFRIKNTNIADVRCFEVNLVDAKTENIAWNVCRKN